ncbi:hypothetical protein ACG91D_06235 [Acinetobacter guillouiae]|uniref:hypothetical protein n=1 Tax=Acinetobacter guillouiae TaxID=106649 RepID=UPI003AF8A3E8
MKQAQKVQIYRKLLRAIFRVMSLYACEKLKAQSRYPDVYCWFEKCNVLLEKETRSFLQQNCKNTSVQIDKMPLGSSIDLSLNFEDIVFIFVQSYWDSYQYQVFDYNKALFNEIGLEKDQYIDFVNQTQMKLYAQFFIDYDERIKFTQEYNLSAFVGKDRFNNTLFQYFKLLNLLDSKDQLIESTDLDPEFIKLIKIVPYFSITSRSSIVSFKSYPTSMGKKYYSELKLPLGVQAGALADNMIHFTFNYLSELFYFKELRDEPCNFDVKRSEKLILGYSEEDRKLDCIEKEIEHYQKIDECINIIESLLHSLPRKQRKIFINNKEELNEITPLLFSILFANFIRKYELESKERSDPEDLAEIYRLPLKSTSEKIKAFYKFLEKGFGNINISPKFIHMKNADNCELYLIESKNSKPIHMSGKNIKDNFANHKKFF